MTSLRTFHLLRKFGLTREEAYRLAWLVLPSLAAFLGRLLVLAAGVVGIGLALVAWTHGAACEAGATCAAAPLLLARPARGEAGPGVLLWALVACLALWAAVITLALSA
jgi:hypothetical protein